MGTYVLNFIASFGYLGMLIGMLLEAFIIVIPSELILATGGILASTGHFTFWGAFVVGLIGSVLCAAIIYMMGYFGGRKFIEKYGKYFFMKEQDIEKSEKWFQKYGMFAAFIGRNFPIIRTFISLPIGIARLNFYQFLMYTAIGSIPWTFLFVWAGYHLKERWTMIEGYTSSLKIPIIIATILLVIWYCYRRIVKTRVCYISFQKDK